MSIAWDEVREDFPALRRRVYLNAAATGPTPPTVRPAVDRFYRELEEGGDVHWDEWMERREQVRAQGRRPHRRGGRGDRVRRPTPRRA